MHQEILHWLIASLVVAGLWTLGRLTTKINRLLNNRRIQRGITEYLLHKTAARS
jgi:hypothetical protein